jgi:hypothetical protein
MGTLYHRRGVEMDGGGDPEGPGHAWPQPAWINVTGAGQDINHLRMETHQIILEASQKLVGILANNATVAPIGVAHKRGACVMEYQARLVGRIE